MIKCIEKHTSYSCLLRQFYVLLYIPYRYIVIINGYDAIREALVNKSSDFAGRGILYADRVIFNPEQRG